MAIRFDNATERLSRTTSLPSFDANYTVMAWIYITTHNGTGNGACIVSIDDQTDDVDEFYIHAPGASTLALGIVTLGAGDAQGSTGSTTFAAGTWQHVCIVRSANGTRTGYRNGASEVTHSVSRSGRTAPTSMTMGSVLDDDLLNGRMAAIKIWTVALTVAEIQQEMYTIRPQRTADLHLWTPGFAHTDISDYSGNGRNWTAVGTLATEDGPPVSWGAPVWVAPFVASAAAIEGTLSATLGAVTSSATGTLAITGTAAPTLGNVTLAATGTLALTGALSATLGAVTLSATGGADNNGTLSATLGAVTASATGTLAITGATSATLGNVTLSAQGYPLINATVGGLLEVDSSNGRYLRNTAGRLVLAGFHTWGNVQDAGGSYPPSAFDWDEYLDALVAKGANFTKLWALETGRGWPSDIDQWFTPTRYVRTGPGNDNDGRLKFDLTQINPDYLTRLRARAIEAGNAGVYVCVQFFNSWHVSDKGLTYNPWTYHPYELANNINSVDGDQDNDGQGYDVNAVSGNVALSYQKALIEAMIDATADLDNVIYEICNESTGGARATAAQAWQEDLLDHAQTYLTGIGRANLVGVTVMYPSGSNTWLDGTDGAWVSYNADKADLVHAATDPPSMYDTDHTTGGDDTHAWVFTAFCEGHGGLWLMDLWDSGAGGAGDMRADADYELARRCLGDVVAYAAQIDLANATPQASLSTTGYCLAKTSGTAQLFVYQGGTGAFDVTLTSIGGTFSLEWYRVSTGATQAGSNVNGGAVRTLTPPWSGEVVAFLELTGIEGTASITLGAVTAAATGTLAISGTASATLAAVTSTATGTLAIAASASITLDAVTSSAAGVTAITGIVAQALDAVTSVAAGTLAIAGELTQALGAVTATATGTLPITGTASATLDAITLSSTGALSITGALAQALDAVTLAATGETVDGLAGELTAVLDAVTAAATGTLSIAGTVAATLDAITLSAAGALPITGATSTTLDAITSTATGALPIIGALAQALDAVTLVAAGETVGGLTGSLTVTLDAITATSTATLAIAAEATITLGAVTSTATGETGITGVVAATLGNVTLSAVGVEVVIVSVVYGSIRGAGASGTVRSGKHTSTVRSSL